jgi:hypothetical protein
MDDRLDLLLEKLWEENPSMGRRIENEVAKRILLDPKEKKAVLNCLKGCERSPEINSAISKIESTRI